LQTIGEIDEGERRLTLEYLDADFEEKTRQAFKYLNRFMLLLWRLGLGYWFRWPQIFGCIMVITHRGRKSGMLRRTPVNFTRIGEDLFCTAAYGSQADWYRNILQDPDVEVWLPDGWWKGIAQDQTETENGGEILRKVLIGSGFAAKAFGLDPYKLSDQELEKLLEKYRLIRIVRTEARTGVGGPGDLAWIWPILSMLVLPILLIRRRSRTKQRT
jgi:deazaflavin-dependent oxidoreductase (nitroreductase family)